MQKGHGTKKRVAIKNINEGDAGNENKTEYISFDLLLQDISSSTKSYVGIDGFKELLDEIICGEITRELCWQFNDLKYVIDPSKTEIAIIDFGNKFIKKGGVAIKCIDSKGKPYSIVFDYRAV